MDRRRCNAVHSRKGHKGRGAKEQGKSTRATYILEPVWARLQVQAYRPPTLPGRLEECPVRRVFQTGNADRGDRCLNKKALLDLLAHPLEV